jgi:hypothetical protein
MVWIRVSVWVFRVRVGGTLAGVFRLDEVARITFAAVFSMVRELRIGPSLRVHHSMCRCRRKHVPRRADTDRAFVSVQNQGHICYIVVIIVLVGTLHGK